MEEENAIDLLQRYRRDRRVLLDFILSGSLIKKVVMPPGAVTLDDVDLDQVSVDYVLNCAKKSEMLELSEAIRDYHDHTGLPQMSDSGSVGEFYLVTDPESSGSPPKRAPPPVPISAVPPIAVSTPPPAFPSSPMASNISRSESLDSAHERELTVDDIEDFEDDDDTSMVEGLRAKRTLNDASDLAVKLPSFSTGITDDDLRETAYEILLACAGATGGLIVPSKEKKKDKRSNSLIRKLGRSKSGSVVSQSQNAPGLVGLLETMRVQLEISEAMDIRTKQGLLNALVGKAGKRMDTLLVPLELLCCVARTEFSDKKAFIRWQKRQLKVLEEGLVNHPVVGFGESGRKTNELRILLAKIEESEFLPSSSGELQRTECLRSLREIVIPLAERPARGDLTGEICHWAVGYHFNVRLYEKVLLSVFDMLDEGKLTEEVEEILELLKSTWRVLGITETIHHTCYAWVLFRQYVITREHGILLHALEQLNKIPLMEQRGQQERLHLKSLRSKVEGERDMSFLQAFLTPIQRWADKQLGDYHLHFSEGSAIMEKIVAVAMITRRLLLEEPDTTDIQSLQVSDRDQIEMYVTSSIKHAFARINQVVERVDMSNEHPLALLAEELKKLLKKDSATFMLVLQQRHPQATIVSASLVHKLYGHKLKPFLDSAEHLSEDVISVFPAAESLEQFIMALITSACHEENAEILLRKLNLYQIETKSGTLVLRWVNSQLGRILGWVERVAQQEHWEPISIQQRHAGSIVEVYRIVEETVDQFFGLKVPMRFTELNSLFRGIDNALQVYANLVVNDLASKEDLIPPVPILTRYSKEAGLIKAFVKKELFDTRVLEREETRPRDISVLTTPILCVQLNTLYYATSHLNKLEDTIWERWTNKRSQEKLIRKSIDDKSKKDTFDGSRKVINAAMERICEYTGTKIIFCDLRVPFIDNLYKPSVSGSRVDVLIEPLDMELSQLCDIVVEPLRDRIVTSLLQASLDGLLRVILDGGPSRVFFPGDAKLLEEDLEALKEFFISGGDGLPRGVVENQVARVRLVIKLHGYETRELIEDLKSASGLEMQGGKGKLGADSKTLLRILCHRSDSEASQFLKKQYKIPKSSA
ncbi:protein unc-13 homolog isoform X2 [Trifolium pratense]|uniref:protein unc-13 homolog isoform X2 n=1 Tax=Trifolium pratense TaxID=57577 RepID=UPI001E697679|nr:protein unc-13 homolog isoform X2 [Trifolium pratense]XP_045800577.1 protein unc-13 homolog isoform X2 [Trifolium pratense]